MESSQSTEAIIALENDAPDVLFEVSQLAPVHLWPLLRMSLARTSANRELGTVTPARRRSRFEYARSLAFDLAMPHTRSSKHVPRQVDTLFMVNGKTTTATSSGTENWLVEELAANSPRPSAILQDTPLPRFAPKIARPTFAETYTEKDLALLVGLAARRTTLSSDAETRVRRFVREVISRFDYPVDARAAAGMETILLTASRRLPSYRRVYSRFLDRVAPRTVVMGNASYTNRPSLLPLLRERDIAVFEPQHGWIGPSHAAYNFGRAFFQPELKQYLPDVLLTFGEYWSENIRHPASKVPIGKAALHKAVSQAQKDVTSRDRILLVSSIYRTEELSRLALLLRERLAPELTVVVRPHPSERASATETFAALLEVDGIELDDEADLYRSFSRARSVVGYSTTVLFEALPFGIPTLVLDSPLADLYTPRDVFGERLSIDSSGVDVILRASQQESASSTRADVDRIWAPAASRNFNALLESFERESGRC